MNDRVLPRNTPLGVFSGYCDTVEPAAGVRYIKEEGRIKQGVLLGA